MLGDYFNGFKMRSLTERYKIDWINLEVGITMGCAISPILVVLAMEVILRATEGNVRAADRGVNEISTSTVKSIEAKLKKAPKNLNGDPE
ncbi:reverse transcriptase [Plakobranchus ocellatus]|uniref:Reverse transcriptase n=1 Tax=Plakobranchus ocellatus TaxID=259542 RepID=A0AAV4ATR9_9GAST|nr:reverse transcriptase [Plakobranchus ocellatus]